MFVCNASGSGCVYILLSRSDIMLPLGHQDLLSLPPTAGNNEIFIDSTT